MSQNGRWDSRTTRTGLGRPRLELLDEHGSEARVRRGRRSLVLLEETEGYELEKRGFPPYLSQRDGFTSLPGTKTDPDHHLVVRGEAATTLVQHVGWGRNTRQNQVEQGGLLLGKVFKDPERNLVYGVAENVVPARLAKGSSSHLLFSAEAWREMLDKAEKLSGGSQHLPIIGWYHTHPGALQVFMSGTDRDTQRQLFFENWHFSIVLNPQRQEFRVFYGDEARECTGNVDESPVDLVPEGKKPEVEADKRARACGGLEPQDQEPAPGSTGKETGDRSRDAGVDSTEPATEPGRHHRLWWTFTGVAFMAILLLVDHWHIIEHERHLRRTGSEPQAPVGTLVVLRPDRTQTMLKGADEKGQAIEVGIPKGLVIEVIGDEMDGLLPVRVSIEGTIPAEDVVAPSVTKDSSEAPTD